MYLYYLIERTIRATTRGRFLQFFFGLIVRFLKRGRFFGRFEGLKAYKGQVFPDFLAEGEQSPGRGGGIDTNIDRDDDRL
jgi:hypothetical protein